MEPYRVRVPGNLAVLVRGLHPELKRKVRAGLDLIRTEPHSGKALQDELTGLRALRVGRLRIVYRVAPRRVIELVAIGPRRTIYEATLRSIRRRRTRGLILQCGGTLGHSMISSARRRATAGS